PPPPITRSRRWRKWPNWARLNPIAYTRREFTWRQSCGARATKSGSNAAHSAKNQNKRLRQRNAWRSYNSRHPQNFGILFVCERTDGQARIFQELYFSQQLIFAHFRERHLPGKALERAEVHHGALIVGMVRIGIRIARNFSQGIHRVLRLAVVTERAVALVDLLQLPQRVWLIARLAPHLFPFYE